MRRSSALVLALAAALLLAAPLVVNPYWMRIVSNIFMFAVLAQGINLMAGYTGYPAFGNVVFFGLGGYVTAIAMVKLKLSFALGMLFGCAIGPLLVLAIGAPLLRLKGHYFAIATLGLNEAVKELATNAGDLTGGGRGISLPLPDLGPTESARFFYYLLFGLMALATWGTWEFGRRRIGLACRAVRDNEVKAEAAGLYTTRAKTIAWMLSAAMTGAAGAVNAYWLTYIDPPGVFDMGIAVKSFVIFLVGGGGTALGPIAGAFVVELLATFTWSKLLNWHLGAMGLLIMLVVLAFPYGIAASARRAASVLRHGARRRASRARCVG